MTSLLPDRDVLARMVAVDTVSHRPMAPLVDWISDYLDRPGLWIIRQEGPDPGKVNLLVEAGPRAPDPGAGGEPVGAPRRPGLTLCGHLDVVPAGEPEWDTDPFELVERDGALVGRGACDMKGFCALAVNRIARAAGEGIRRPLAVLFTYDEEVGSLGARHFVERWPGARSLPRSVLIGEPTSLRAARMHKGHLRVQVTVRGRPAHSGSPHLGVNAIEPAGAILSALARLRRRYEEEGSEHGAYFGEVPFTVLAVTRIRGGQAQNVIPDRCEIEVGIRVMPGMESGAAVARLRRAVSLAAADASVEVESLGENPPLLTPAESPLHRALTRELRQTESVGVPFASDGGWLATAGYDCVLFGPGSIEVAHRPNEHLPADEFEAAGRHLDSLIGRMCEKE